jgi:caa(3)-type oxidase subunit IV
MTEHEHTHDEHAEGGHAHESHGSTMLYLGVFAALCVLTGVSFMTTAPWWHANVPPMAGWLFMLAVAVAKAVLVALVFMHLTWERSWKYVVTIPAVFLAAGLVLGLIPDILMRQESYSEERQRAAAAPWQVDNLAGHGHGE